MVPNHARYQLRYTPMREQKNRKQGKEMGWLMGIEPTYVGITIRCVNHFATATIGTSKSVGNL